VVLPFDQPFLIILSVIIFIVVLISVRLSVILALNFDRSYNKYIATHTEKPESKKVWNGSIKSPIHCFKKVFFLAALTPLPELAEVRERA